MDDHMPFTLAMRSVGRGSRCLDFKSGLNRRYDRCMWLLTYVAVRPLHVA